MSGRRGLYEPPVAEPVASPSQISRYPSPRTETSAKLIRGKRRAHEIVRTELEAKHCVLRALRGRADDDRNRPPLSQVRAQHQAVHIRQHEVNDDEVRLDLAPDGLCFGPTGSM